MEKNAKIYVAGHRGLVGSAIVRNLRKRGYENIITRTHAELDLTSQSDVNAFFEAERPEYVFLAAAKVGGIGANNTYRAQFIYENLMIEANVIHASYLVGVRKLMFLGSSCIYPRMAAQPIEESALLTAELEPTNEPYAIAKIAGIKMCDAYRAQYGCNFVSVMPTNLYGPGDNYDLENSHVLPAMIRKFVTARNNGSPSVTLWGDGSPLREFMHSDDMADATVFCMLNYNEAGHINIGSGREVSIARLADMVAEAVGYRGKIVWDTSKPNGMPRKLMDTSKLFAMGWKPSIDLKSGIDSVVASIEDISKKW